MPFFETVNWFRGQKKIKSDQKSGTHTKSSMLAAMWNSISVINATGRFSRLWRDRSPNRVTNDTLDTRLFEHPRLNLG